MRFISVGNVIFQSQARRLIPTGSALIAAITASRLGLKSVLITKCSPFGKKKLTQFLKGKKVKLIAHPSPRDTVMRFEERVVCLSSAGRIPSIEESGNIYYLAPSLREELNLKHVERARRTGGIIVMNAKGFVRGVAPDGSVIDLPWLGKGKYLENADILKINPEQLYYMTGKATLSSASNLLRYCSYVLLTLGDKGAYIFHEKKHIKVPVYEVKKVKAITGAGDVFATSFSIKLVETNDVLRAAYFASAAASFYVEGGISGIPTRKKIEKRAKVLSQIFL